MMLNVSKGGSICDSGEDVTASVLTTEDPDCQDLP